jgi:uncharacterized membrane protein
VQDPNGMEQAFLWDPESGMHLLSTRNSMAYAINERGWVVGGYEMGNKSWCAFLWDQTHGLRDLGSAANGFRNAFALNDVGQAIVVRRDSAFLVQLDEDGAVQTCDSLPLWGPPRVNGRGQVAGMMRGRHKTNVGLWDAKAGVLTLSREAFQTGIVGINDAGQVLFSQVRNATVCVFGKTVRQPPWLYFLWDPNQGEIPLNRYAALQEGETFWATDINNNGGIVGRVRSGTGGASRVVLLEPIRERWPKRTPHP